MKGFFLFESRIWVLSDKLSACGLYCTKMRLSGVGFLDAVICFVGVGFYY